MAVDVMEAFDKLDQDVVGEMEDGARAYMIARGKLIVRLAELTGLSTDDEEVYLCVEEAAQHIFMGKLD